MYPSYPKILTVVQFSQTKLQSESREHMSRCVTKAKELGEKMIIIEKNNDHWSLEYDRISVHLRNKNEMINELIRP